MVFTPLLANACVGTLEPRSVAQPIIRLQVRAVGTPCMTISVCRRLCYMHRMQH